MDLDLDPTQTLLRDTVREYLEAELPFDRVRRCEREGRWDEALWRDVVRQGWLGLPFPELLGGGDGGLVGAGLLVEEFARRAAVVPIGEALAATLACVRAGPPERAGPLVEALLAGEGLLVPAVLERGDRLGEVRTPVREGLVSGEKLFVDYGGCAREHLVAAREAGAVALHRVEVAAGAVECHPLRTIGRTPCARVLYRDAPATRATGPEGPSALIALARVFAAVQCLGAAQQALDMTVAYAKVREQFGRPIGSFQAVQHHAANMASRVAATRFLVYEALHALDRGSASPRQIAFAKASASRMVPEVTMLAHQIHGGNGMIEENDLYFFTLRGKERSLAWGSAEECLAEAAASVEEPQQWLC